MSDDDPIRVARLVYEKFKIKELAKYAIMKCLHCPTTNEYADPNTPDGKYICYECRDLGKTASQPGEVVFKGSVGTDLVFRRLGNSIANITVTKPGLDPRACPACGDCQSYGPPCKGVMCSNCFYEPGNSDSDGISLSASRYFDLATRNGILAKRHKGWGPPSVVIANPDPPRRDTGYYDDSGNTSA